MGKNRTKFMDNGKRLESKVIPISDRNLVEIISILERTKDYIPYCNSKCHEGVIRKEETEKVCIQRGCKHYEKYYT